MLIKNKIGVTIKQSIYAIFICVTPLKNIQITNQKIMRSKRYLLLNNYHNNVN